MGKAKNKRSLAVRGNPGVCCLCGLPIPSEIACSNHPLYGTIDHIVPTSRNGPDIWRNRSLAHRICNERKANYLINPEAFASECRPLVIPLLERLGRPVTPAAQARALKRVLKNWSSWAPVLFCKRESGSTAIGRWEDDGGRTYNYDSDSMPDPPDQDS